MGNSGVWDRTSMDKVLQTEAGKHIHGRVVGACEVAARMLGMHMSKLSRKVKFLTIEPPGICNRVLKQKRKLDELPDNSTDIYSATTIALYMQRPLGEPFDKMTIQQYFEQYNIVYRKTKKSVQDKTDKRSVVKRKRPAITRSFQNPI